jgi:hypothetical protein
LPIGAHANDRGGELGVERLRNRRRCSAGAEPKPEAQAKFITIAFEQVLARPPAAAERAECEKFLSDQALRFADPKSLTQFATGTPASVPAAVDPHQRARENLVHVLLNHNDFVTIR